VEKRKKCEVFASDIIRGFLVEFVARCDVAWHAILSSPAWYSHLVSYFSPWDHLI